MKVTDYSLTVSHERKQTLIECYFKQTCTHLLKTTNVNTKPEDQHDNSKHKIIMSREITKTKQVIVSLMLSYFQHVPILLTYIKCSLVLDVSKHWMKILLFFNHKLLNMCKIELASVFFFLTLK